MMWLVVLTVYIDRCIHWRQFQSLRLGLLLHSSLKTRRQSLQLTLSLVNLVVWSYKEEQKYSSVLKVTTVATEALSQRTVIHPCSSCSMKLSSSMRYAGRCVTAFRNFLSVHWPIASDCGDQRDVMRHLQLRPGIASAGLFFFPLGVAKADHVIPSHRS